MSATEDNIDAVSTPLSPPSPAGVDTPSSPTTDLHDDKPYPHCPVYIPSRGRSEMERGTLATLVRDLIPFVVVAEPDEADAYSRLIDHYVFQHYGDRAMVHPAVEAASSAENEGHAVAAAAAAAAVVKNDVDGTTIIKQEDGVGPTCACCQLRIGEHNAKRSSPHAVRVSAVYHHGYTFSPPTVSKTEGVSPTQPCGGASSFPPQSPSASTISTDAFTLRTVDEVRSIFRVATLPLSNQGVSYVRNYILHILVPQEMVANGLDRDGHMEELGLFAPGDTKKTLSENDIRQCGIGEDFIHENVTLRAARREEQRSHPPVHGLYGYYWVMDDDIFSFNQSMEPEQDKRNNQRISARQMMREVESRIRKLLRTAVASDAAHAPSRSSTATFTCKEDAIQNNLMPMSRQAGGSTTTTVNTTNYTHVAQTACFSLEYSRFAYTYDDTALAVNSYNNIACLFSYNLLHNPMKPNFFPQHIKNGLRSTLEVLPTLQRGVPDNMMWYRFSVREDYDFTLQLIARGMYTLRFRNLSFDVPQMSKVKGGMTEYYKSCTEDIKNQNKLFVEQWPSVAMPWVKGKNSTERDDIRVRWDLLHPARARYPGAFLFLKDPLPQLQPQQPRPSRAADAASEADEQQQQFSVRPPAIRQQKKVMMAPGAPRSSNPSSATMKRVDAVGAKRRRSVSSTSSAYSSSSSNEGFPVGVKDEVEAEAAPPVVYDLPDVQPAELEDAPSSAARGSGWKGYAVERWRDLSPEEAERIGLKPLALDTLRAGTSVAIVLPLFSQTPSVVLATLLEKVSVSGSHHHDTSPQEVCWTVVARARGIPPLTVSQCYAVPEDGTERLAAAVDYFFSKIKPDPSGGRGAQQQQQQQRGGASWLDDDG